MFFENVFIGKNQFWRYLLTTIIFITCLVAITFIFIIPFRSLPLFSADYKNLWLLIQLAPLAIGFAVFLILVKYIHKKPVLSILTSRSSFDFKRFFFTFILFTLAMGFTTYIILPGHIYQYQFSLAPFIKLLAISIILLPFQCALEEVVFRGYLLQAFGNLFKNKLVSLCIVSLLFAAIHIGNPEFDHGFYRIMAEFLFISLFFGLVVVLDNGLEISIGIHTANNIFLSLFLSPADGALNTDAIFTTSVDLLLPYSFLLTILPAAICFAILYYKYNWRFSTLLDPIKPPIKPTDIHTIWV